MIHHTLYLVLCGTLLPLVRTACVTAPAAPAMPATSATLPVPMSANTYAITGVTVVAPARFMGRDDRLGTVAEGKTASLVLVKGNPLDDVRNTRLIEGVFLRGKYYDRADLDRLLSEAREIANSGAGSGSE